MDVLMAPHHGSRRIDAEGLVDRARPWLIVSSQGPPLGKGGFPEAYLRKDLIFWNTNDCGAITLAATPPASSPRGMWMGSVWPSHEKNRQRQPKQATAADVSPTRS